MTAKQFAQALERLELNHSQAARVLGIGRSSVIRYLNGEKAVPPIVQRMLYMITQHGAPEEWA